MCVSRFSSENVYSKERRKMGSKHAVKFSKGTWHHIDFRERKSPSRGVTEKCEPHERNPCASMFEERAQEETLHQERCARRVAWNLAKIFASSKIWIKLRFTRLLNPGQRRRPLPNLQRSESSRLILEHQSHCEEKGFELRRTGDTAEIQEPPQRW